MLGVTLLLVAGCTGVAPLPEPDNSIPERFLGASPKGETEIQGWWRLYGSAELNRLMDMALADNLDINAATARLEQAQATVAAQAKSLATGRESGTFGASASGSWTIDIFGKNRALLEQARQNAWSSEANRDLAALTASSSLATAYIQLLAYQDRLALAERNASIAGQVLAAIKARVQVGTASDLEVAQEEALVASTRAGIPVLRQQVESLRNTIAVLVARPPQSLRANGGSLASLRLPQARPGLPSSLLYRRPDVKAAEYTLTALKANVAAARAAFFPTLTLTGSTGWQSADLVQLIRPENWIYSIGGSVAQTIFDGGTLAANLDLAKTKEGEALYTYRKSVLTALSDVDNALTAGRETTQQVRYQGQAATASERAFRIIQDRLNAGTVDLVTLLQTQQTYFNNQDSLIQARLSRMTASVSLFQALGGGWRDERMASRLKAAEQEKAP
jgi:multidrug efflux system outer membrane protein